MKGSSRPGTSRVADPRHDPYQGNSAQGGVPLGDQGPGFLPQQDQTSNDDPFKIRRKLTTKELTKKIKLHQAAIRRERRRFIAGAERPPVSNTLAAIIG